MFNNEELKFYHVIDAIAKTGAPIVFKGAMVTKILLNENKCAFARSTKDIDADWVSKPPTMEELERMLNKAVQSLGNYKVIPYREYQGNTKSAGFEIYEGEHPFTTIDISMKDNPYYETYNFEKFSFRGSSVNKILADKISAVSTEKVFRRAKDVVDIYALSSCVSFDFNEINRIAKESGRTFGDFSDFMTRREELEHAYQKLKRIVHKPNFNDVYEVVKTVLTPFIEKQKNNFSIWSPVSEKWECPSLESRVYAAGKKIATEDKTNMNHKFSDKEQER